MSISTPCTNNSQVTLPLSNGSLRRLSLEELQDRAAAHARLLVSPRALDASLVRRMHRRVGYACVAKPEQRSALNRCTCQKLASCVGSAPVARRGAPAAAAPSACSASNVHNSPTQSTPGLRAQFLKTRHRRLRRGSSSHAMRSSAAADGNHAGLSGIRCASLASAATHAFAPLQRAAPRRRAMPRLRRVRRF